MTKTWLDSLQGWEEAGTVVDTYWIGDPAIDREKSDSPRYLRNLEKDALAIKPGQTPITVRIALPNAPSVMEIRSRARESYEAAAAAAFELCVTFPDAENIGRENVGGSWRLPRKIMMALIRNHELGGAEMINVIGSWVIRQCFMTDEEKKLLSPGSMKKTSESQASTTAPAAPSDGSGCKDAPTSETAGTG